MSRTVYYDNSGNEVEPPKADAVKPSSADRIRSMTDEELDIFLNEAQGDAYLVGFHLTERRWLDWLKEEANDGNHDH